MNVLALGIALLLIQPYETSSLPQFADDSSRATPPSFTELQWRDISLEEREWWLLRHKNSLKSRVFQETAHATEKEIQLGAPSATSAREEWRRLTPQQRNVYRFANSEPSGMKFEKQVRGLEYFDEYGRIYQEPENPTESQIHRATDQVRVSSDSKWRQHAGRELRNLDRIRHVHRIRSLLLRHGRHSRESASSLWSEGKPYQEFDEATRADVERGRPEWISNANWRGLSVDGRNARRIVLAETALVLETELPLPALSSGKLSTGLTSSLFWSAVRGALGLVLGGLIGWRLGNRTLDWIRERRPIAKSDTRTPFIFVVTGSVSVAVLFFIFPWILLLPFAVGVSVLVRRYWPQIHAKYASLRREPSKAAKTAALDVELQKIQEARDRNPDDVEFLDAKEQELLARKQELERN